MKEIVIHQSKGTAGWFCRDDNGQIINSGTVIGERPDIYLEVSYQAAIDALTASVNEGESVTILSPTAASFKINRTKGRCVELAAKLKQAIAKMRWDVSYTIISPDSTDAVKAKGIARRVRVNKTSEGEDIDFTPDYTAYTDGSCNTFSPVREGGSAYIILKDDNIVKQSSKGFLDTTNNRMELMAILSAVASTPVGSTLLVITDSQYCITMLSNNMNAGREGIKNADIIHKYFRYAARLKTIRFKWVKGHNGNKYNEMVDSLAFSRAEEMRLIHEKIYGK